MHTDTTTAFEIVNPHVRRRPFRAALFDFDGTLSLLREGWVRIMVEYGVEVLRTQGHADDPEPDLHEAVREFVLALNGHPTIHQMRRLAEEVEAYGGTAAAPELYLEEYLRRLKGILLGRRQAVAGGAGRPDEWVVPNARALLRNLRDRGVAVYVASGTYLADVSLEADLLRLTEFFGPQLYAPAVNDPGFSKARVVDQLLAGTGIRGEELLGFGDGVVETREVKRVGGVAVGVASVEQGQVGVSPWKRATLIQAGADVIVADYRGQEELMSWLFGEE